MKRRIEAPFSNAFARTLSCGESVLLSGTVYTARDAAHKRLVSTLHAGAPTPFDLRMSAIYYAGPSPAINGRPVGACGPTTSYRMDAYAPELMEQGVTCMIGKGVRSREVIDAMQRCGAVYLAAIGGAGALISACIVHAEVIAYDDLGAEAVRRLTVRDLPLIVAIDSAGNSLYTRGREQYLATR